MEMLKCLLLVCGVLAACIFTMSIAAEGPVGNLTRDVASERRLYESLLAHYNKDIMPAIDQPLTVQLGLSLIRIHKLDTKTETLEVHSWLKMSWKDAFLRWNAAEYGGIDLLRIPKNKLWLPDITLYNSIEPEPVTMDTMAIIYNDGTVSFIPRVNLKVHCSIARNIDGQPEDVQNCSFKFGSWVYNGYEVDLDFFFNDSNMDLNDYLTHPRYLVISATGKKNVKYYPCCSEPYPDITFKLTLRRVSENKSKTVDDIYDSRYHQQKMKLETSPPRTDGIILTIVMVLLVPTVFLLPPASKEKITLGVGILVSMSVLLANDATHKLAMLWETNMVLVAISIVLSAILLNVWHNSDRASKLPSVMQKIVYFLAKICCVGVCCSDSVGEGDIELNESEVQQDSSEKRCKLYSSDCRIFVKVMDRMLCLAFTVITLLCLVFSLVL